jgi:uncharacterized protein YdeI (YjbR/CyaY-like superfamily)
MVKVQISGGVAHPMPTDLEKAIINNAKAKAIWETLTPLARNEWICWTITVKQVETRNKHIKRTIQELQQGKRRPCCWVGCIHRQDKALSPSAKWVLQKRAK